MAAHGAPHTAGRRQLLLCAAGAVACVAGFFAASAVDWPLVAALPVVVVGDGEEFGAVFDPTHDWSSLFRLAGFAPVWAIVGVAFWLVERAVARPGDHPFHQVRQLAIIWLSVGLAGGLAELLKVIVRRARPAVDVAEYVFRPLADRAFYSGGLGMPSSHTAVAFAAMICMWRLHPPTASIWIILAIGCGATRVLDGSHFVSDVYVGALVGIAAASLVWAIHVRNSNRSKQRLGLSDPSAGA